MTLGECGGVVMTRQRMRDTTGGLSGAATVIAAVVLVSLVGLWHTAGLAIGVVTVLRGATDQVLLPVLCNAVTAGSCVTAAGALLARRSWGRGLAGGGCVLALAMYGYLSLRDGGIHGTGAAALAIVAFPALAAVVLVSLPPTARRMRRTAASGYGYRQEPGHPQPWK